VVGENHFVTTGTNSPGWVSTIADSTFTLRNATLVVPLGAVKIRCSLVSGGSATITGVMVIDDLSVARAPVPNLVSGNFWLNPSFELGTGLDQTDGTVQNWNRGGNDPTICVIITNNFTSASHALAIVDTNAGDFYGEWYSDLLLAGHAAPGDTLSMQWFEMYSISDHEMRLTVFLTPATPSSAKSTLSLPVRPMPAGWAPSRIPPLPSGTVCCWCRWAPSRCAVRWSPAVRGLTGVMVIDDLSVAKVPPWFRAFCESDWKTATTRPIMAFLPIESGRQRRFNRSGHCNNPPAQPTPWPSWIPIPVTTASGIRRAPERYAVPGDLLDIKWSEMYGTPMGEMRVTVGFFTAAGAFITETHSR
jgi:hypothetical protein